MVRSHRRAALAALVTACTLAVSACGSDGYVGSGVWSEKPEAQTPEGQVPGTPEQTPPPTTTDPENPDVDPAVRATGLDQPSAIVGLPDGTALVGERVSGTVTRVFAQQGVPQQVVYQIPGVDGSGTGGLLGFALPPNYLETGLIYAYITTATDNRVVSINKAGVVVTLVEGIPKGQTRNGGAITVGADGTIVVATGDTGNPSLISNTTSLAGKILMFDQFGDPVAGTSLIARTGFNDPTALCTDGLLLFAIEAGAGSPAGNTGNALYSVIGPEGGMTGQKPVVSYSGDTAGAAGCVLAGSAVVVTGLDSKSLMTTLLDATGAPTGDPELSLTDEYGRLRAIAPELTTGGIWVATYNRDGIGQPAADDDKVLLLPPPSGASSGDVS